MLRNIPMPTLNPEAEAGDETNGITRYKKRCVSPKQSLDGVLQVTQSSRSIYKKGDPETPLKYSPICLVSSLRKIIERTLDK